MLFLREVNGREFYFMASHADVEETLDECGGLSQAVCMTEGDVFEKLMAAKVEFIQESWCQWSRDTDAGESSGDNARCMTASDMQQVQHAFDSCQKAVAHCKKICAGGASGSAADLIEKAKKAVHELQNGPMRKVDELMWGKPEDVTTDVAKSVLKEAAKSLGNVMLIAKEIKALARVKTT